MKSFMKKVFNKSNAKYLALGVAIIEDNPVIKGVSLASSFVFAKLEEHDIDVVAVAKEFATNKKELKMTDEIIEEVANEVSASKDI